MTSKAGSQNVERVDKGKAKAEPSDYDASSCMHEHKILNSHSTINRQHSRNYLTYFPIMTVIYSPLAFIIPLLTAMLIQ